MSAKTVFISHAWDDKPLAYDLQQRLALRNVTAWLDAREMTGGDALLPTIKKAIDDANYVLVILSPNTINSAWVTKEVQYALKQQKTRTDGFKVIPLLLPGIRVTALSHWFKKEPIGISVEIGPGELDKAIPHILAALGERLPTIISTVTPTPPAPVAELTLKLTFPAVEQKDGKRRAVADATLHYRPADATAGVVESDPYAFVAPLGPIETDDLTWYLEQYHRWPTSVYLERARRIEEHLPEWGKLLYDEVMQAEAHEAFAAWNGVGNDRVRRFSVSVAAKPRPRSDASAQKEAQKEAQEAATLLLALPWELLHDERSYLFQGARGVRVRRQLPNRFQQEPYTTNAPVRILLVSPRPDDGKVGYIDHRVSARPLVDALAPLGGLAHLTILTPPTFPAMVEELTRAKQAGTPYHVVHFDGHGVYDPRHGLGALVFEDPKDEDKSEGREHILVDAEKIAQAIRDCRVPLFFLEACQSAMSDKDPTASVAGKLLEGGVASVVTMSHSVLVETAKQFVTAFYGSVLRGERVGQAMLAGQLKLQSKTWRGRTFAGDLHLHDWFVPVLYQEEHDPQLVASVPADEVQRQGAKERASRLGKLPDAPEQTFVGRSHELLRAERRLHTGSYVVIQGEGGEGKTTLGVELARWLVESGRFQRAAFVSFEKATSAEAALSELGNQLVTNYQSRAGQGDNRGWLEVERALIEQPTVIVLDNLESVLKPPDGAPGAAAFEPEILAKILTLCKDLQGVDGTRLVFTSREAMPPAFHVNTIALGRLPQADAVKLVAKTLGEGEGMYGAKDDDANEQQIEALVEAVVGHARALVLLTPKLAQTGIHDVTAQITCLMRELERDNPDQRERSLLASVKLSLDRLPQDVRKRIRPLGVCQGGISLTAMAAMLQFTEREQVYELARPLIGVGLGEAREHGYLRFDPALAPTLLSEMSGEETQAARTAWAETMQVMAGFLYQQRDSAPQVAFGLAGWELPNLLAALEHQSQISDASDVVAFAIHVEDLAQHLGRGKAVAQVERIRKAAADAITNWSSAAFNAASAAIDRLLDAGRFGAAIAAAEALLQQCEREGEAAYPSAAYDMALTYARLGRARQRGGVSGAALAPLQTAETRFMVLEQNGSEMAARMATLARTDRADCLMLLGRLDEAARLYAQVIREAEQQGDSRQMAVGKGQLSTVRLCQRRYGDALQAYEEVRDTFEQLEEPQMVANVWHQIGMVYRAEGNYPQAEQAYQNSLQINRRLENLGEQAITLGELGNLYDDMKRHEEAVRFYREAATIYAEQQNLACEGNVCSNAVVSLLILQRYDEARFELERAIACKTPFGHASETWKTFDLLHGLEWAVSNKAAAQQARQQAIQLYLAYRQEGGESQDWGAQVVAGVAQALAAGQNEAAAAKLAELLNDPQRLDIRKPLLRALQRVVSGERDMALADAVDLYYMDAVELRLLLETLTPTEAAPSRPTAIPRPKRTTRRVRPAEGT